MSICYYTTSSSSVISFEACGCDSEELTCLTQGIAACGCEVVPTWTLFQTTLNNPGIITNLETDGTYVTVSSLISATAAEVDLVPGIGPASLAELSTALDAFNLQFKP